MNTTFAQEVIEGLSQSPKKLSSKYFYNEKGDKLFQEIMKMDEYYLTKSEYEIFSLQKEAILQPIMASKGKFQIVEFGAGDGLKTKLLLEHLISKGANFEYIPIDISEDVLVELKASLTKKWPTLICKPIVKTYFDALKELKTEVPKMVLFLGSNIGNFNLEEAHRFLKNVNKNLNINDYFLLGVDLKKDPETILAAYNDSRGITKSFNLNLLSRMNEELGANFDLESFKHWPTYDPISGETKSHLISMKNQKVIFKELQKEIQFNYAEPIFMEISKKYDLQEVEDLTEKTNFKIIEHFYDCKHYFLNSLWQKK